MKKIALVTGGGSGIGRAGALTLGANGYHVVVTGRRMNALEESIRLIGYNATAIAADSTSADSVGVIGRWYY
jgi:NADP-dependent 3-hydroxy acid dehydrogenase YdfG